MLWRILRAIGNFLRRVFVFLLAALLIGLFVRFILPLLIAKFTTATVFTVLFFLLLILIIIIVIILIRDTGKVGLGGCALQTFSLKPDRCVNVSCPKTCISMKGPYPSWLRSFAPGTQDVGCICPTVLSGGLSGLPPDLQRLLNQALAIRDEAELRNLILQVLMREGINSDNLDRLLELLKKLQMGGQLTPEEIDELQRILTQSP